MATPTFSAKLPDTTMRQLKELAVQFGVSKSQVVIQAVRQLHQQETAMKKYSHRQHIVEKIADLIVGHRLDDATVDAYNKSGWTVDIRFKDGEYISENNWSRVENIHLDSNELATAKRYAADLEASL